MPTVTQPRLHHLALTVTDLDASVKWYETIFDVHFLMDVPHPGGVGKILADPNMRAHVRAAPTRHQRRPPLHRNQQQAWTMQASSSPPAQTWKSGRNTSKPTA